MSVMKIPKFRVKIFVHIQEQNDCINTYMRLPEKPKTRKPQEGWLAKASFPHVSWRTFLKLKKKTTCLQAWQTNLKKKKKRH